MVWSRSGSWHGTHGCGTDGSGGRRLPNIRHPVQGGVRHARRILDSRLNSLSPELSSNIIPELDLEYFFTKNFSSELILGVTKLNIKLSNQTAGSTYSLPPTLTLKYHPLAGNTISPYIGFGMNVMVPFDSKLNGVSDFKIDPCVGWAAQAGTDIKVTDNIYFNLDYKYLNADTKARIAGVKYKLDLNPHLFGIGVGYRF